MDSKVTITTELDKGSIMVIETTSVVSATEAAKEAIAALLAAIAASQESKQHFQKSEILL